MTKLVTLQIEKFASLLGLRNIETPSDASENVDFAFDGNDCLLIRSDNLQALSSLVETSGNCIDFCYIDPPYNTGQEFAFSDNRVGVPSGIWGKHHDWIAFMLPRLVAAHAILKPCGIIAISIDDYEYAHLKILMDNIFGADKYISTLIVARSKNGKGSKQHVAVNHEYVLLYGKTNNVSMTGLLEGDSKAYDKKDEYGAFTTDGLFRKKGDASLREERPNMYYPLYYSKDGRVFTEKCSDDLLEAFPVDSQGIERRWLWGKEKATEESWKLYASPKGVIYVKNYKSIDKRVKLRSILDSPSYLTDRATTEIKGLYGEKVFETPKPISLIRDLIDCCCPPNGFVIDFFAGTGTTAEAVWELNVRDEIRRKVILVEHDHQISAEHVAAKRGFSYTSDLTEFRLRSLCDRNPDFSFKSISIRTKPKIKLDTSKAA